MGDVIQVQEAVRCPGLGSGEERIGDPDIFSFYAAIVRDVLMMAGFGAGSYRYYTDGKNKVYFFHDRHLWVILRLR